MQMKIKMIAAGTVLRVICIHVEMPSPGYSCFAHFAFTRELPDEPRRLHCAEPT